MGCCGTSRGRRRHAKHEPASLPYVLTHHHDFTLSLTHLRPCSKDHGIIALVEEGDVVAAARNRHDGATSGTDVLRTLPEHIVRLLPPTACSLTSLTADTCRIGVALADTLDDLISSGRIQPQLAMRIMQNFDQSIATILGDKVKARMSFKV